MAKKSKVWIDRHGVFEILKSPEVQAMIRKSAGAIARSAESFGGEYDVDEYMGKSRALVAVRTMGYEAIKANATHNALEKSIGAGKV
jgi:hypothetical protein